MPENPRLFRSRLLATPLVAASAPPSAPAETPERDRHPLDPLTIAEYGTVVRVLERDGRTDDDSRFALVTLDEPDKARLRGRPAAAPVERRAFAIVKQGPRTFEAVVDLVAGRTLSWTEVPGVQPGFLLTEEWLLAQELVRRRTRADRPIADTDIVLWYTLGQRHVVRSEDWPVLPTSWNGFELRPFDFFDRNPALDLPAAPPARAAEGPE